MVHHSVKVPGTDQKNHIHWLIKKRHVLTFAFLWLQLSWTYSAKAERPPDPVDRTQVLVLLSYHPDHSWEKQILKGISEWPGAGAAPLFHIEWMDTKRHPGDAHQQRLTRYLADKYAKQRFDIILSVDDNALDFVSQHDALFGDTPVVFSGVNGDPETLIGARKQVTGILERFDLVRTLRSALSLHPDTQQLVIITPADANGAEMRIFLKMHCLTCQRCHLPPIGLNQTLFVFPSGCNLKMTRHLSLSWEPFRHTLETRL